MSSSEQNIRNMTRERLDMCINAVGSLLKRAYSLREKAEMVELFKLDLVGVCFRSEFLEKKIQAVKQLGDIARNLAGNKFVKLEELMAWVKEQRVFEQLFSKTVHIQLLQRTSDFLRFLITNDRLELPLMEQVFELMTSDDLEIRQAVKEKLGNILRCTNHWAR
jgi:hypothetical protein